MERIFEKKILQCLADILKKQYKDIEDLDMEIPLDDLGFTSLLLISFVVEIEEELKIEILDSDLLYSNFSTKKAIIRTLSKYLEKKPELKKCLILDADNVLWKGISGEEQIVIDEQVMKFQRNLLNLYNRGVLLCLCSRNHPNNIEEAFSHPSMLLKKNNFIAFYANYDDKTRNIISIIKDLNLSVDSFVFADDSDYEIGLVNANFPEINTIKVCYQNMKFLTLITDYFKESQSFSPINRTDLYRAQKEREKVKHKFLSVREYNATLETKVVCNHATLEECSRLSELSNRTHQFNMSQKSYQVDELKKMIEDPEYIVLSLTACDKYGDMGIVGMAIVVKQTIEAFMISCRVFDRDFEHILSEKIKEIVGPNLIGIYQPDEKSKRFSNFFSTVNIKTQRLI